MRFTTDGLIINESPLGENDRIVTVLTSNRGIIRAFVKGALNIKSPKSAATRLLCYSEITVYEGREKYIIDSAQSKEMFIALRLDIEKMSLAQYFCQLCSELVPYEAEAKAFLQTALNSLYVLSKGEKPLSQIKAVFEMRMLAIAGYMPDLVACKKCGRFEDEKMAFIPDRNCIFCSDCRKEYDAFSITTGLSVTEALRHCIYSEPKKLFSFKLSDESLYLLENAAEIYLLRHIDRPLPTLDFYKAIRSS